MVGPPIAGPLQVEDLSPLGQPVQDGVGHRVVREDLVPFPEHPVGRDDGRPLPVVADGEHLEEQVAFGLAKRRVPDLVNLC